MATEAETWKNATKGKVYVLKYDRFGNTKHELVSGKKSFSISKSERQMNQDRAANDKLDVFKNGILVPVRLLEGDEEAKDIASNPNLMSETDMRELFASHWKTFEGTVKKIENIPTLNRLIDMASEVDATVRQVEIIKTQMNTIEPAAFTERDVQQYGNNTGGVQNADIEDTMTGKAVTPR